MMTGWKLFGKKENGEASNATGEIIAQQAEEAKEAPENDISAQEAKPEEGAGEEPDPEELADLPDIAPENEGSQHQSVLDSTEGAVTTQGNCNPTPKLSMAYFTNWGIYGRQYTPNSIPQETLNNLTHILYSFANIRTDGTVYLSDPWADEQIRYPGDDNDWSGQNLYGNFKQFALLKKKNRNLKLMLSIGGATFSGNFAGPASTDAGRKKFASTAVTLLENYGLDGLDLDWEFPSNSAQAGHYTLLLKECREALNAHALSKKLNANQFQLSIAAPCGFDSYQKLQISAMDQYLDFWNLMAYDFAGSWDSIANHQAALYKQDGLTTYYGDRAVKYYMGAGVANIKIVLGIPLYGRSFLNCSGAGSIYKGVGMGKYKESGLYDYSELPPSGFVVQYNGYVHGAAAVNLTTREWITYDNIKSAARKARYICDHDLGGAMYWEVSGDKVGTDSIINLVAKDIHILQTRNNNLNYSSSKFKNLAKGF